MSRHRNALSEILRGAKASEYSWNQLLQLEHEGLRSFASGRAADIGAQQDRPDRVSSQERQEKNVMLPWSMQRRVFGAGSGRRMREFGWGSGSMAMIQSRKFSILPWKTASQQEREEDIGGQKEEVQELGTIAVDSSPSEIDGGPDSIVQLSEIAENAAMEAAMEGCWLPTRALQWALDSVHNASGLPWWQSIMLTTVIMRASTLPIMIMQIKNTYRLSQARPEIEHLVAHMKEEQAKGNPNAVSEYQQQVMRVWAKYKANPLKSIATMFVQAPLFIGFFSALRAMAAAKVPSLVDGGTLWFNDLSVADPTYGLPLLAAGSFLLTIELNAADGMEGQTDKMRSRFKNIMRGVAVIIVPFTIDLPAAVFMYWTASNCVSLAQASLLKIPSVKSALGIPNLQKMASPGTAGVLPVASSTPAAPLTDVGKPMITYTHKPVKNSTSSSTPKKVKKKTKKKKTS